MLCRFCEVNEASSDSHIIPKSFFLKYSDKNLPSKLVSDRPGSHPKRSRTGIYDQKILCQSCEKQFNSCDSYGYSFFHETNDLQKVVDDGDVVAFVRGTFDYLQLKLFLLAVLWRASVSTAEFCQRVNLGPYEARIRDILREKNAHSIDEYEVIISRFDYDAEKIPILCPLRLILDGLNVYRMLLNGFVIDIKVDNRPFRGVFLELSVRHDCPIVIVTRPYASSDERRIMSTIIEQINRK